MCFDSCTHIYNTLYSTFKLLQKKQSKQSMKSSSWLFEPARLCVNSPPNCPVMKRHLSHLREALFIQWLQRRLPAILAGKIIRFEQHQSGKLQICESMSAFRVKSSDRSSGVAHWQRIREKRLPGLFEKSTPSLFDSPVGLTRLLTPHRSWQEFSLTFYYIKSDAPTSK